MNRLNDTLYAGLSSHDGKAETYQKVTTYFDGTSMTDAKCDGIIYRKATSGEYFKRTFDGIVDASWYGITGDGVTNRTTALATLFGYAHIKGVQFTQIEKTDILISGTLTITGGKKLIFRNGSRFTGTATVNGNFLVDCSLYDQCFAPSLTSVKNCLLNDLISVRWFGAVADDYIFHTPTDNAPMFKRAIDARCNITDGVSFNYRSKVYIPADVVATDEGWRKYRVNSTVVVDASIEIYGDGMDRTVISAPSNINPLKIAYRDTVTPLPGARLVYLHDFSIYGQGPYGYDDANAHGVYVGTTAHIERVHVQNMNGNGFFIQGNSPLGNTNNTFLQWCRGVSNGANGFLFDGADANNITVIACDGFLNGRWGFWDSSFLGNTFIGCHTAGNGRENQYNLTAVTHNPGGGIYKRYYCIQDCAGIQPGVTANWQLYWEYLSDVTSGPNYDSDPATAFLGQWKKWDNTTTFKTGGGYYIDDANNVGGIVFCYAETGDQHMITNNGNGQVIGGFASLSGTIRGSRGVQNGTVTESEWQAINRIQTMRLGFGVHHTDSGSFWGSVDNTNGRAAGWMIFPDGSYNFATNLGGLAPIMQAFSPDAISAYHDRIGRSAIPSMGYMAFGHGAWFARDENITDQRKFSTSTDLSNISGEHADGDIYLNAYRLNTAVIGYKCYSGGTPGLWGIIGECEIALTDGATISTSMAQGKHFKVTLAGNRTMAAPDYPQPGQELIYMVRQDATGGRTLTWDNVFDFGDAGAPTLSAAPNLMDIIKFKYHSGLTKWCFMGAATGYGSGA